MTVALSDRVVQLRWELGRIADDVPTYDITAAWKLARRALANDDKEAELDAAVLMWRATAEERRHSASLKHYGLKPPSKEGGMAGFFAACEAHLRKINEVTSAELVLIESKVATYSNTVEDNARWTDAAVCCSRAYVAVRYYVARYFAWLKEE